MRATGATGLTRVHDERGHPCPTKASQSASASSSVVPNACSNRMRIVPSASSLVLVLKSGTTRSMPNLVIRKATNEPASR
jgi:hypothetical protein